MDGRMVEGSGDTAELRHQDEFQPQLVVHRQPVVQPVVHLPVTQRERRHKNGSTQLNGHVSNQSTHKTDTFSRVGKPQKTKESDLQLSVSKTIALSNSRDEYDKYTRWLFQIMDVPTLKIGCAGLGRMGKRHADHFLHKVPRSTLVAVSTPSGEELAWAKKHLEPFGVSLYKEYDDMLKHPGLQAVVIASVTTVHAEQTIKALELDKHVLCEKPLSTEVEISQKVVTAAAQAPHLKVMCGFSRRFDDSYRDAISKVAAGAIGTPSIFRSQTCDKWDPSGSFIDYAKFSGGIFVDCSIHDIDLCLWFFASAPPPTKAITNGSVNGFDKHGKDKEVVQVKSVQAVGVTAMAPQLRQYADVDNAIGVVEFWDERVAYFYCSRMMVAGQEDCTEIIGTGGKVSVNTSPQRNLVSLHEEGGIRKEIPQDYFQRFENAFVKEGAEFVKCCLDGGEVPVPLEGAVKAVEIGCALQESLRSGEKIEYDEGGKRKNSARL